MAEQMDFLKLSTIPVNYEQKLETDLLEPVVFNDGSTNGTGFVRFTLQRKGVLHSHSKLFLSIKPNTTAVSAFIPPSLGIGTLVESARLMVGNQVLNEISSWSSFHSVKSMLIPNENNVEREQYTTGRGISHQFVYAEGEDSLASTCGLSNGREYDTNELRQHPFAKINGSVDASGYDFASESPVYSLDLADLFPFLNMHQLPLFMIEQDVSIEITLAQQKNARVGVSNSDATGKGTDFSIDRNELKFCADYIFWGDGDDMMKYKEQHKSQTFSFVDYRLSTTTIDPAATSVIRNIGMANRMVNRVITTFQNDAGTDASILNKYANLSMAESNNVAGTIEYNIRYNDRFEYSSNISNPAQLFSLTQQAEGVPGVLRQEYSNEGESLTTADSYEGYTMDTLAGQFFFVSSRLTGGRVGQRGIELQLTLDSKASVTTMRNWCEYLRVAVLEEGIFTIFNA